MAKQQYRKTENGLYVPGNDSIELPKPKIPRPWWAGKFTPLSGRAVGQIKFVGNPPKVLFVDGKVCFNPDCCCGLPCQECTVSEEVEAVVPAGIGIGDDPAGTYVLNYDDSIYSLPSLGWRYLFDCNTTWCGATYCWYTLTLRVRCTSFPFTASVYMSLNGGNISCHGPSAPAGTVTWSMTIEDCDDLTGGPHTFTSGGADPLTITYL